MVGIGNRTDLKYWNQRSFLFIRILIFISLSILFNCSLLKDLSNIQKPTVSIDTIHISGLSFNELNLLFDIGIENTNPLSVTLAGMNYEFYLNNQLFIQGSRDSTQIISAGAKSKLEIPLILNFQKIYQTYQTLKTQDSSDYKIKMGLIFDLPVIGRTTLPLTKEGKLPLIKFPSVKLSGLKLKNINLTTASLELEVYLENPNNLNLMLNQIFYELRINGKNWISGDQTQPQKISAKTGQLLKIPFSINFLEIGQTVFQTIKENQNLNYNFSGNLLVEGSDSLISSTHIPFVTTGNLSLKH